MFKVITLTFIATLVFSTSSFCKTIQPEKAFNLSMLPIVVLYFGTDNWNNLIKYTNTNKETNQKVNLKYIKVYPMKNGKLSGTPVKYSNGTVGIKGNTSRQCPQETVNGKKVFYKANFSVHFGKQIDSDIKTSEYFGYDKIDLKFFRDDWNKCRNIYSFKIARDILEQANLNILGKNKYTSNNYSIMPFASYTHLYIAIEGPDTQSVFNPLDTSMKPDQGYNTIDYGLYQLVEDNDSDGFRKLRFGHHKDKDGYFWKCAQNRQTQTMGGWFSKEEKYNINANLYIDLKKSKDKINSFIPGTGSAHIKTPYTLTWLKNQYASALKTYHYGSIQNIVFGMKNTPWDDEGSNYLPSYDFKGSKTDFNNALSLLVGFIYNLNYLGASDTGTASENEDLYNWLSNGTTPEKWNNPFNRASCRMQQACLLITL